jgi:protein arginine N-methyltransferase 1
MMQDETRMSAYRRAIERICPGKVVCEIGVGLGPLSLMALQSGAKRVYGIEVLPDALEFATRVIRSNGFGPERFIPVPGMSCEVDLPERVDVLLFEVFDSTFLCENVLAFVDDARNQFLKPGGVFLPERVTSKVVLAAPAEFVQQRLFWGQEMKRLYGMDYSVIDQELATKDKQLVVKNRELHSDWVDWARVDFADPRSYGLPPVTPIRVRRAGRVFGFCVGFDAELSAGIHLRTFPEDPETHWKQGFVPFKQSLICRPNDVIYLSVELTAESDLNSRLHPRFLHLRGPRTRNFLIGGRTGPAWEAHPLMSAN